MIIKQWCKMVYKETFIVYKFIVDPLIAWQSSYMNLCYAGMLEQLSLLTWSSTDFVGINWRNWGVLLVAVTAFLCKLVSWVSLNIIQSPWSNTEVGTTACGQKWFRFRHLPYIFHIKPLIFITFSWSHCLADFHEIFTFKNRIN